MVAVAGEVRAGGSDSLTQIMCQTIRHPLMGARTFVRLSECHAACPVCKGSKPAMKWTGMPLLLSRGTEVVKKTV